MTTINHINKDLKILGDIKLVKGNGCFYFVGNDVNLSAEMVCVYRLNEMTPERWFEEAKVALKVTESES